MSDLRELYQDVILDHGKRPRNFKPMDDASHSANGYNPLCGDKLTLFMKIEDGIIREVTFQGSGCAISTASASMMTQSLKGKTLEEARAMFENFHDMIMGKAVADEVQPGLGKLTVFAGVSEFPTRVKCATLAWHTLNAAMEQKADSVSTE